MIGTHRRIQRLLPAYHTHTLPPRQAAAVASHLAACATCRAESAAVAAVGASLLAGDPAAGTAGAPNPAALDRLQPALHAALRERLARPHGLAPVVLRPAFALACAALLYGLGLLTGAQAFPRQVTREVTVVREVRVPEVKTITVQVKVPVEKRVEVPVEREVVRWRTRTVTRVVYRDRGSSGRRPAGGPATRVAREPAPAEPAKPQVAVLEVDPKVVLEPVAVRTAERPETVSF